MVHEPKVGEFWGRGRFRKRIREVITLSNGWYLIKTDNSKSKRDFKVKVIFQVHPSRSMTPKHAHFAIDLYGKICASHDRAKKLLEAIIKVWSGNDVRQVVAEYQHECSGLPGYPLEYILHALNWILEQEDLNFNGRPGRKQEELNNICNKQGITLLPSRKGSHLAIALLCDIMNGTHPVEALLKANIDVAPRLG
ncbi:MAG: hypothetical protein N2248_04255 [candidate division WOR-3 bacterium]|uniref:Uncharacterized protein n=1 Tax=candidate division WOR-3 bacterium TaxID=2052148 RepID=A0A7C1NE00_UNCW3|nr:hypothetical protein [candidate division WOR-3 bacterium]